MFLFLLLIISISSTTTYIVINSDQSLLPKFDQSDETVSVVVGKRALLPCYVSLQGTKNNGTAPFKVIWMKLNSSSVLTMDDRTINEDPRILLLHAYAEEWNLQIDDIDEDDAGVYRCFINTGVYKTVTLDVKVPPKIIDEITTESYPAPIRSGSNFTIRCYAHGRPTPRIRIISYDQSNNPNFLTDENEITIFNVSRYIDRRYECVASNNYPPDVARSFELTIQYAPELTLIVNEDIISNVFSVISYQKEVRLRCQILMFPRGKFYWMKNNKKINHHSQNYKVDNYIVSELIIRYFIDDYQGEYTCVASNSVGSNSKSIQLLSQSTTTTAAEATTTTTTTEMITSRHKRPKHPRIKITTTEYSRMMTLSSTGRNHTYQTTIIWFLLFTVVYFK